MSIGNGAKKRGRLTRALTSRTTSSRLKHSLTLRHVRACLTCQHRARVTRGRSLVYAVWVLRRCWDQPWRGSLLALRSYAYESRRDRYLYLRKKSQLLYYRHLGELLTATCP